ncbi:hypothetical protein ABPG72_010954 [Tetrahymena utriculariae]
MNNSSTQENESQDTHEQQDQLQNQLIEQHENQTSDQSNKLIEEYLQKAGGFNRYQKIMLFFFFFVMMVISMVNLSQSFIYLPPKFICDQPLQKDISKADKQGYGQPKFNPEQPDKPHKFGQKDVNNSLQQQTCQESSQNNVECEESEGGCKAQILAPNQKSTYAIQLDMYCEQSKFREIACSLLFVGSVIGSILLGIVGDIFGRKKILIISWALSSLSIVGITLTQSIPLLIVMNFTFGFFSQPVQNLLLLLVNEETSESHRQFSSQMLMVAWAIGEICLLPLAYLINNYRDLMFYWIMIPSLLLNIPLLFVIESPSYCLSKNMLHKTIQCFQKLSKFNKKEFEIGDKLFQVDFHKDFKDESIWFNIFALFKFKSLRGITIASSLIMICTYVFYFGSEFALEGVGYSLYLNQAVASFGELIPLLVGVFIIPKIRRQVGSIISNIGCILICLSYSILSDNASQTTFVGLLRVSNGFQFGIFQVFIPELFPTQVRSVGTGIIFGLGNLGSVLAPYIVSQASKIELPNMVLIGLVGVIGFFACFFLEETLNKPLENQIKELKNQEQLTHIFSSDKKEKVK